MSTTLKEKELEILEYDIMNKIHHIDCLEFMKTIPDNYFDLVLTDPPYGMEFVCNFRESHNKHKAIKNDNNLKWLPELLLQLNRITDDTAHLYIFCSWHNIDVFKREVQNAGMKVKNILIWHKGGGGMGDLFGDYLPEYEMCLFINKGKPLQGKRDGNVLKGQKDGVNNYHPTQKPLKLFEYLLKKSTSNNSRIFDPFMGGGTTAIACKSLGLDWCGCELEADYVEIANKRLEKVQLSLF